MLLRSCYNLIIFHFSLLLNCLGPSIEYKLNMPSLTLYLESLVTCVLRCCWLGGRMCGWKDEEMDEWMDGYMREEPGR